MEISGRFEQLLLEAHQKWATPLVDNEHEKYKNPFPNEFSMVNYLEIVKRERMQDLEKRKIHCNEEEIPQKLSYEQYNNMRNNHSVVNETSNFYRNITALAMLQAKEDVYAESRKQKLMEEDIFPRNVTALAALQAEETNAEIPLKNSFSEMVMEKNMLALALMNSIEDEMDGFSVHRANTVLTIASLAIDAVQ